MTVLLVGTGEGLVELGADGAVTGTALEGREIDAVTTDTSGGWALVEGAEVWHVDHDLGAGGWRRVARTPDGTRLTCLLADSAGLLVGTAGAHLLRLDDHGRLEPVDPFSHLASRGEWYTPWGGPPDTRSLVSADDGTVFVGVHVGGVVSSTDRRSWGQTSLDIDADVHQVLITPGPDDLVMAACAQGLAISDDHGSTWRIDHQGLHAPYARALAVAGDTVVLSVSTGPQGHQAALYRRPVTSDGSFERCRDGLPEWFAGNVDTGCLVADGATVVAATPEGEIFRSDDRSLTWALVATGLGPVSGLALAG